jgi:hypothetical protein
VRQNLKFYSIPSEENTHLKQEQKKLSEEEEKLKSDIMNILFTYNHGRNLAPLHSLFQLKIQLSVGIF